jgi:hypothetical protein
VELAEPLPSRMPLFLRLQTDCGALAVEGQVAWAAEAKRTRVPGGGILHEITFTRMTPEHHQALRDLLLAQRRERRAGVRLPIDLPVLCKPQGAAPAPFRGGIGNLSRGGLMLCLDQPLPPGIVLDVTLRAPRGPITMAGEVVWVDPGYRQSFGDPIRHGVRFHPVDSAGPLALARVLSELKSASAPQYAPSACEYPVQFPARESIRPENILVPQALAATWQGRN